MALAFRISHPQDFSKLFAAHDEYSSILNNLFGRILTPNDDFYTAPFCFMPQGECGGFVVMTCQVPWLHGHGHMIGMHRDVPNSREQHFQHASRILIDSYRECYPESIPYVEMGPERMQRCMELEDEEVLTFTEDGGYPGKDDICQGLEDNAVRVTCAAMGWEVPKDWRLERERQCRQRRVKNVFDLAEYDTAKLMNGTGGNKRMKYTITDPYAALNSSQSGEQEEKEGCFHDSHDVEHGSDEQQVNQQIDPYSTLISRENGEHEEKKDSCHDSHDMEHGSDEHHTNQQIDPFSTLISRESGEHEEEKKDSFHDGYTSFGQHDTIYNEESNIINENEHHTHSRVDTVEEQQHGGDVFCEDDKHVIDESKDGVVVEI